MRKNIKSHIKSQRLNQLPEDLRQELKRARTKRCWTQAELGRHVGLPQMHISGIETGKIVPRFDTLLDLARILDQDLLMIPRELVPMIQSLVRDHRRQEKESFDEEGERPLYALDDNDDDNTDGTGFGGGAGSGAGFGDGTGFGGGLYSKLKKRKKKRNDI
jgi:transcriptional regulator with XRE-family HTH domain